MKNSFTTSALAFAATFALIGCVHRTIVRDRGAVGEGKPGGVTVNKDDSKPQPPPAQPVVVVQPATPAPAPPVETRPPAPGTDYVWIDGNYRWRDNHWEWNPGYWQRRS